MNSCINRTEALYRCWAAMVATYLGRPGIVDDPTAQVPLENLYRLLEMFRYDAFSDSDHVGVLSGIVRSDPDSQNRNWHARIKQALSDAMDAAYSGQPKEAAIDKVEAALRGLVNKRAKNINLEWRAPAKTFFDRFAAELSNKPLIKNLASAKAIPLMN